MKKLKNSSSDQEIKKFIKHKFQSVARFSKLINMDSYDIQRMFVCKNYEKKKSFIDQIITLANVTKNKTIDGYELSHINIQMIKTKIERDHTNVNQFCNKHTDYTKTWISKLLSGGIKKITPKVQELIDILNS